MAGAWDVPIPSGTDFRTSVAVIEVVNRRSHRARRAFALRADPALLPFSRPLSIENGELTSTLKLRRRSNRSAARDIEKMYSEPVRCLRRWKSVRTVMVTGATGAIGSVARQYLLGEESTEVRLLIRARSRAHLDERLNELYRFWDIDPQNRCVSGRVEALAGDVTLPRLGLDDSGYQRLAEETTHVVHSAGNVKLNRPLDEARRSAVDGARQIVSFVDACAKNGGFQKLEFVSTVGVAGNMAGTVPERRFSEPRSFRNSYEAAKAEAETFVLQEIDRGLPATIHRPSMVVGDAHDGKIIQFQVFYYLCEFLSGRRTAGIIPDAGDIRLDIIPVDYVARAIQESSLRPQAIEPDLSSLRRACAGAPNHAPGASYPRFFRVARSTCTVLTADISGSDTSAVANRHFADSRPHATIAPEPAEFSRVS